MNKRAADDVQARVLTPDRLSPPVTVDHEYLAAILRELIAANEMLAALYAIQVVALQPAAPASDVVELREPKKRRG